MFSVSVADNPDSGWEVVLSGNLTHRWQGVELPIEEHQLHVAVVDKQFVKFEFLSHYQRFGGLEYDWAQYAYHTMGKLRCSGMKH